MPVSQLMALVSPLRSASDTVVVGAPYDDDAADQSGAAYLLPLPHEDWTRKKRLSIPPTAGFGASVAVTHDIMAVGSPDDGTKGAVYIFYRNSATDPDAWAEKIKLDGYAQGEQFGYSVSLSGDKLAVGAPYNLKVARKFSDAISTY
jgi:hypothetical protein